MSTTTTTYTVRAHRDGDRYWLVHIPEIDHYTQARTVAEIDTMARDLIATLRGLDPTDIALDIDIALPGDARQRLDEAANLREQEARMRRAAADNVRDAAASLHRSGIPLRDIGKLLGVSFQRAGQLVQGDSNPAHRA